MKIDLRRIRNLFSQETPVDKNSLSVVSSVVSSDSPSVGPSDSPSDLPANTGIKNKRSKRPETPRTPSTVVEVTQVTESTNWAKDNWWVLMLIILIVFGLLGLGWVWRDNIRVLFNNMRM